MAKKMDATYVNILNTIENAQENIQEAVDRADDAKASAEDAGYLLKQLIDLIKIRREYENDGELLAYVESMEENIEQLKNNIIQIKKGR